MENLTYRLICASLPKVQVSFISSLPIQHVPGWQGSANVKSTGEIIPLEIERRDDPNSLGVLGFALPNADLYEIKLGYLGQRSFTLGAWISSLSWLALLSWPRLDHHPSKTIDSEKNDH